MKGATPAISEVLRAGVAFSRREFDHQLGAGPYALEAAEALGVDPNRVLKTLIVAEEKQLRNLAVGIIPANRSLNLKAMAAALGVKKVVMAPPAAAERSTGYVTGGISPLGQRRKLPTVIDGGVIEAATVFVSGGQRGLELELKPEDLIKLTNAVLADISQRFSSPDSDPPIVWGAR